MAIHCMGNLMGIYVFRFLLSTFAFLCTLQLPAYAEQLKQKVTAPNILLIITDDVGFGASSAFGGVIPTPTLEKVAEDGLRYTQFHSAPESSATRAALITGRNPQLTAYPGFISVIEKDTASVGEILKQNGFATSWFGKDHNTPAFFASQAGPFDQWPIGMGFEYFFGFIGNDTSQWQPQLFRNTTAVHPFLDKSDWNLTTAMADDAIQYIKMLEAVNPKKPFLIYYAPGGTHAPHHPTAEWIEKFKGKFDLGWNAVRDQIFANQKKLGLIPQNAKLTPWPDYLQHWNTLSADEKKMFARQAEVYAAYLAYTDHEIGRVIQAVADSGKLDNTVIIYINGDNTARADRGLIGTPNEVALYNGVTVPLDIQLQDYYDKWGSDQTYPNMASAWVWAFEAPYKWSNPNASHFGGTRQGMAISWPNGIKDAGGIRSQFHHVVDVMPTILEITGITQPNEVNGITQKPIDGTSMAYTFDQKNANAASQRTVQYFETAGNRAIYHEGWVAATTPWPVTTAQNQGDTNQWELYKISKDWTEYHDLADSYPEKLIEMKELYWTELAKYHPMSLSDSSTFILPKQDLSSIKKEFTYTYPLTGIPLVDAPSLLNTSYKVIAEIEIPKNGAEGIIATQGGRFGGWGFYLLDSKPVFLWNLLDLKRVRFEAPEALHPGKHTLEFNFRYDGKGIETLAFNNFSGVGQGGTGELKIDGAIVASKQMKRTIPLVLQWDETFNIGSDTGTPVDDQDYHIPFKFTGNLEKLTITLNPPKLTEKEEQLLKQRDRT